MSQNDYSLEPILKTLYKERKFILYTLIGVALVSAIVSLCVPVYYKANTTFYAASPDLGLPNAVSTTELPKQVYGTDYDIDRLLAIANSEDIYSFLINKYNLFLHYDIDSTDHKAPYYVREELKDMYKVIKTKLGAIQLTVEDEDPDFAANMANDARERINLVSQGLMKESQAQTLSSYQNTEAEQLRLARLLGDSLNFYKTKYNIIDTKSQGEVYSELVGNTKSEVEEYKAILNHFKSVGKIDSIAKYSIKANTSEQKLSSLIKELELFNLGKSKVIQLEYEYDRLITQIALDGQRKQLLHGAYSNPFTALHVVEEASPPVIKSRPKRALIVLVSTFLAVLCTMGYILLRNSFSQFQFKEEV